MLPKWMQVVEAPRMFLDNQRKAEMACPDPTPTLMLMSLVSWYDSIPFHFRIISISALMLTYYDAWNRRDASRKLCKPT